MYPISFALSAGARVLSTKLDRYDVPWIGSILAYATLSIAHAAWDANVLGVTVAWLVFRGARSAPTTNACAPGLGNGIVLGTLAIAAFTVVEIVVLGRPRAEGPSWFGHPNLLAHVLLVTGLGIVATTTTGTRRSFGIAGAMVALVLTGSRSGLLGLVVAVPLALILERKARLAFGVVALLFVALVTVAVVAEGSPWAQRVLGPLQFVDPRGDPPNLLIASEALDNPAAWTPSGVVVTTLPQPHGDPAVHVIERTRAADWARPQQLVNVAPGSPYTVSAEFAPADEIEPGFLGWAQDAAGNVEIRASLTGDGARVSRVVGFADVVARDLPMVDGWRRLEVTFTLDRLGSVALALGPSPDLLSDAVGATASMRSFQFERGARASAYQPTSRIRVGGGEALARLPIWSAAVDGIAQRPWIGWGPQPFATFFVDRGEATNAMNPSPAHAHNQFLSSAFAGGVLGVVGLGLLLFAFFGGRGAWARATLAGLLVANLFDSTLLVAIVLLPAAFLSGASFAQRPVVQVRIRTPNGHGS